MEYYAFDSLQNVKFEKGVLDKYRKTRFALMRKGFLGDAFTASATDCIECNACIPLRINTFEFQTTTRQKKLLENFSRQGGKAFWTNPFSDEVLYNLYQRFLRERFPKSPMLDGEFADFAVSVNSKSDMLILTNTQNEILGYASVDKHEQECSLDYIAYDPNYTNLRLGNVAFLTVINWAYSNNIPYIYIGPINETASLRYKRYYSGLETFDGDKWVSYDPKKHTRGPDYDAIVQRLHEL